MKRFFVVLAIVAAFVLNGCAPGAIERFAEQKLNLPEGVLTESIDNPITPKRSAQIQQSLRVVVAGLRAHKRLCKRSVLPPSCVDDVNRLQGYVRDAKPVLARLRVFVEQNDQVNARLAFNEAVGIIKSLQRDAINAGVVIQAVK